MFQTTSIEVTFLATSVLLLLSLFASKLTGKFSIPVLAIFLGIGMLAGSEGIGRIYFDNALIAKGVGIAALCFILFSGGLDTDFTTIRAIFVKGILLSTVGVLVTALIVGLVGVWLLNLSIAEGMLLGAIVSSTDAAAVFSVLRSNQISLKKPLKPLLEFESGSNDPMAVFLTIAFIELVRNPAVEWQYFGLMFLQQMGLGFLVGVVGAWLVAWLINRIRLEYEGLYPVLTVALVVFIYSFTASIGGNGFLAVYLAGLNLSRKDFFFKRNLMRFHEGLAWLMQIGMFLTLGLLVFPSHLVSIIVPGLIISTVLFFLARPLSVMLSLSFSGMSFKEKHMVAWVGLRGAAPIVLATFPLLAGVEKADMFFNIVFFVVLMSVLVQGTSIPFVAKLLKVNAPLEKKGRSPLEFERQEGLDADLIEFIVPYDGKIVGRAICALNLPPESLAVLVCRGEKFIVAKGTTVLEAGDVVMILASKPNLPILKTIFSALKEKSEKQAI